MRPHQDQLSKVAKIDAFSFETDGQKPVNPPPGAEEPGVKAPFISMRVVAAIARFAEGLVVLAAGLICAAFYPGAHVLDAREPYLPMIVALSIALPVVVQIAGGYSLRSLLNPLANFTGVLALWSLLFGSVSIGILLSKTANDYSRIWVVLWFISGGIALSMARAALYQLVLRWNSKGQLSRLAVMIGGGEPAMKLQMALNSSPHSDVRVIGTFDDRGIDRLPEVAGAPPRLGNISQLVEFVRKARVDMLLVTLPLAAEDRLLGVLNRLWVLPVDIRLSAQNQKLRYRPRAYSYVGEVPFLDVFDKPLGEWGAVLKAIEDRVIAAFALIILSPVFALAALAIKLDSRGPVFFIQKRFGFNNELIEVYKFRSMRSDMSDFNAEKLATRDDPRITRVGKFLRRTSLDELPQLINVLNGTLSLVGPRPHATKAKADNQLYFDIVDGYYARHKVKPGITGWAQINGWRGETDTREKILRRVEHDLYYIENWSLAFDLYIITKTPLALLKGENAY